MFSVITIQSFSQPVRKGAKRGRSGDLRRVNVQRESCSIGIRCSVLLRFSHAISRQSVNGANRQNSSFRIDFWCRYDSVVQPVGPSVNDVNRQNSSSRQKEQAKLFDRLSVLLRLSHAVSRPVSQRSAQAWLFFPERLLESLRFSHAVSRPVGQSASHWTRRSVGERHTPWYIDRCHNDTKSTSRRRIQRLSPRVVHVLEGKLTQSPVCVEKGQLRVEVGVPAIALRKHRREGPCEDDAGVVEECT